MNGPANVHVEFYKPFQPVSAEGYSVQLLTQKQWDALQDRMNIWRLDLRQDPLEPRTDGVGLNYNYGQQDCTLEDYTVEIAGYNAGTPVTAGSEAAAVEAAIAEWQEEVDELAAKSSLSADELDYKKELEARILEVRSGSFWRDARNPFGDGCDGLYRALAVPNVDCSILSNAALDADRAFSVWVYRCKPLEDQVEPKWYIQFGGRWRFELEADRGAKLYLYRDLTVSDFEVDGVKASKLTADAIDTYRAELKALQDKTHYTPENKQAIKWYKDDLEACIVAAKQAGRKKKTDLTPEENLRIARDKKAIKDIRESIKAGLTGDEQRRLKTLNELFYEDVQDVQLYQNVDSLYNVPFVLTFIPQARGFLTIKSSFTANYWTYEDKTITSTKQFGTVMKSAQVRVGCNGGAFWWKWAHVNVHPEGHLLSKPIKPGGNLEEDPFTYLFSGCDNQPPGTTVRYSLVVDYDLNSYRWRIDFTSDGRFMPFVYTSTLTVDAGPRNADLETLIFTTEGTSALLDATPKFDPGYRARGYDIKLLNENGSLYNLLKELEGSQVRVFEGAVCVFTGVAHSPEERPLSIGVFEVTVKCVDRWDICGEAQVWFESVGDGALLSDYLVHCFKCVGFRKTGDPDTNEILITDVGAIRLPAAAVGTEALIVARFGNRWKEHIQKILDTYANGCEAYFDGQGRIVFGPKGQVTSSVHFVLSHADAETVPEGDVAVVASNVTARIDTSQFYNVFVVTGAKKPGQQRTRYWAYYVDWDGIEYLGRVKKADPVQNDELNTQEVTNTALRRQVELYGTLTVEASFECNYLIEFTTGLRCKYCGMPCEITGISSSGRKTGRVQVTVKLI